MTSKQEENADNSPTNIHKCNDIMEEIMYDVGYSNVRVCHEPGT